jgi:mono/diheme cytochrome c family protein
VISLLINGVRRDVDSQIGRAYMPGFGAAYSDGETAAVTNYVTGRFGSQPSHITPDKVAMLRLQH